MTETAVSAPAEEPEETGLAVWRPLPALPEQPRDETALHYLARLMELLPPQGEDVIDAIAQRLLDADTMGEENSVWDAVGSKDAVNQEFVFHSCHLQPTDYPGAALPWYLVCKVTTFPDGEKTVLTTGSVNIMVQLVKAQVLGRLPWHARIVGPRKPTKSGNLPLHLVWMARVVEPEEDVA